jgi:hypothetical protein
MNLISTMENNKLISNEYYSLSELFSTPNRKIIIPDFQRDYCWGDKTHGEKRDSDIVSGFLDTLMEEFENNKESEILLGKIDVYQNPKDNIYLTDGQQRITTLYLLIGMLYRKLENTEFKEKLKRCLISDFEENTDDKEPYLQYAVRESTVFFLRDLVNEFFLKQGIINVSDMCKQPWYFKEYDFDPSIFSMIKAMEIIETKFKNEKDLESFSKFIIDQVKIQYYDVQDKSHGEERFVIINTTGKSLSVTENVKPILLGNIDALSYAQQWEDRETYFWKNRSKDKELIADDGVNDFLKWCFQIENKIEDFDIIKKSKELLKENKNHNFLDAVKNHFNSLITLIEYLDNEKFQQQFKFINDSNKVKTLLGLRGMSNDRLTNVLIPMLSFMSKYNDDKEGAYQFLRRLRKNYFDYKWKDRNKNYIDWRYILQIIKDSDTPINCLNFDRPFEKIGTLDLPKSTWYNDEEKIKNQLKANHQPDITEWEDHPDFMGDLSALLEIADEKTDYNNLATYYDTYNKIQLKDLRFSENINFKNLYRLISYLYNGDFEHRSVAGKGYCMLNKSSEPRQFIHKNFESIWKKLNNCDEKEVTQFLFNLLKVFLKDKILKDKDLNSVCQDTRKLGHYERVQIWAILEFINSKVEFTFDESICQFWEYPNLRVIVDEKEFEKNNYEIGNLLLGTSYYNNKSGWIDFKSYPLMKDLSENRESTNETDIKNQTNLYKSQLENLFQY